jgi:hypothetical protein
VGAPDAQSDQPWEQYELWERVRESLYALPAYFRMEGELPNIPASDLHAANTLLGAAIEEHIPVALNLIRQIWDPQGNYADCLFRRQPQTFPDVPFRRETGTGSETLFGIEVKSWYVLAKEQEPSFRFYVNRDFCHPADLCVVYPWALSSGVSGTPKLFRPLVIGARKAARLREESWAAKAQDEEWRVINKPQGEKRFHPTREDRINDSSPRDAGNNMGRIARTGVWDLEIRRLMREERISGIPIAAWHAFLSSFREGRAFDDVLRSIRAIAGRYGAMPQQVPAGALNKIAEGLSEIAELIEDRDNREPASRRRVRPQREA